MALCHPDFNPRSDERSDSCNRSGYIRIQISIHAPTNGATIATRPRQLLHNISIHAPTNGATVLKKLAGPDIIISIHAPTNGATLCHMLSSPYQTHFNPRSDERSDGGKGNNGVVISISIHAPTNGATKPNIIHYMTLEISIHAPTNGATSGDMTARLLSYYFNPRSDERSDLHRKSG